MNKIVDHISPGAAALTMEGINTMNPEQEARNGCDKPQSAGRSLDHASGLI
jgi:hypothetical protein